jgi:uncharacterized protein YqeY
MKAKDDVAKAALSGIKAKITEAEKLKTETVLSDVDVTKVIMSAVKQYKQSYDAFIAGDRGDLAEKEFHEMTVLQRYLPAEMSESEIRTALAEIIQDFSVVVTNPQALIGKSIGEFNKKYTGRAEVQVVKRIATDIVNPL